jgi:hypothetical protein
MTSLTQAPATREHLDTLIAELYGDPPTPARGAALAPGTHRL